MRQFKAKLCFRTKLRQIMYTLVDPSFTIQKWAMFHLYVPRDDSGKHGYCISPRCSHLSLVRKPAFCICENKDADQLFSLHSTIPLLSTSEFPASSHLLWLYSLVCVGPGRKLRRPVFSQ